MNWPKANTNLTVFQFEPTTGDMGAEKKRALGIMESLQSGRPTLDTTKAVNQVMTDEDRQR